MAENFRPTVYPHNAEDMYYFPNVRPTEGVMMRPQIRPYFPSQFGMFPAPRQMMPYYLSDEASSCSTRSQENELPKAAKNKTRASRTEWSKEETEFLLRLWADNYNFINSVHARKAWKKVVDQFNKKFKLDRKLDILKRKVNYHIEKYKEVSDWNKNQSGGQRRDCDFFEILDGVLGTRDIVNFADVVGAGFEAEQSGDGFTLEELAAADEELFGTGEDTARDDMPKTSKSSFEMISKKIIIDEAETNEEPSATPKSTHIEERDKRKKGKKKRTREDESEMFEKTMEEMTKQEKI